jgi:lipid-A-disaccharide synthase
VWASRAGRAKVLARLVDHLLALHSFEAPYFEKEGLPTTVVGNAVVMTDISAGDPARLRAAMGAGPEDPILLLAPGSRPSEIKRVMPAFVDAARILTAERPALRVVLPVAQTVADQVRAAAAAWPFAVHLTFTDAEKYDAMKAATVALACSGSVTTELALAGCPMVVGYRIGPLSALVVRRLMRIKWITLFNITAQDFIAPELVQEACTGPALAKEIAARLDDPEMRARQAAAQTAAVGQMGRGGPDPAELSAEVVLRLVAERRARPASLEPARF